MNWTELAQEVGKRTNLPATTVRGVLDAAVDVITEQLAAGQAVRLNRLGTLATRLTPARTVRSVANSRKLHIGERYLVRFRPTRHLREAANSSRPALWRQPEHQAAWRLAETLVADLALYHRTQEPRGIGGTLSDGEVRAACASAFGRPWGEAERSYIERVPEEVRAAHDHLADAARRRWSA